MERKGLLIGIDYSDESCRMCYYSEKHGKAQAVAGAGGRMRYDIPTAMCFDEDAQDWLTGDAAREHALNTGAFVFSGLLSGALSGEKYFFDDEEYPFSNLLAIFLEKLLEQARVQSGVFPVELVSVTMRRVNADIRRVMERIFEKMGIGPEKLRLINYSESFAYFILREDPELWADGALLFDLSQDGFFIKQLTPAAEKDKRIIYVNDHNRSMELSVKDLSSQVQRPRLDYKLSDFYDEINPDGGRLSVYFTGSGFEEYWFSNTVKNISQKRRVFKGNNIYARGACLKAFSAEAEEKGALVIVCRPRTKAEISVEARKKGKPEDIILSPAAVDWYEASSGAEFILDETKTIVFKVTSVLSRQQTAVRFDLSSFPDRPPKTTRVRAEAKYINEHECEICVTDLGFGDFFPASGLSVRKILDLEGYI